MSSVRNRKADYIRLVCETSGAEGLPQYAVITLTAALIRRVLTQHAAFMSVKTLLPYAEMLRLLDCGDVTYYDRLKEFSPKQRCELSDYRIKFERPELFDLDFFAIKNRTRLPEQSVNMSSEYLCIYEHCVCWLGVCKHVDGEVETRTIAISDLEALLKGLK